MRAVCIFSLCVCEAQSVDSLTVCACSLYILTVCVCVLTGADPSEVGAAESPGAAGDGGSSQRTLQQAGGGGL